MSVGIFYPTSGNFSTENDGQMINVYDVLFLEYASIWSSVNLTLNCRNYPTPGEFVVDLFYSIDENPIAAEGIYDFGPIYSIVDTLELTSYPARCFFILKEVGDDTAATYSAHSFWVTSNAASSTTFSPTVTPFTLASTGTSTSTQTTDTATTVLSSSASPSAVTATQAATETQASTETQAATETQTSTPGTSPGLSAGAAAGIGVGVGLAVFILAAAILFMFLRRRKAAVGANPDVPAENPPSNAVTSESAAKPEYYSQHQQQDPQEMEAISPAELENGQSVPAVRHELSG